MPTQPDIKARPGCCEEASSLSHNFYIPCNAPAKRLVAMREAMYRMCEPCALHNVNNRGGKDVGPVGPYVDDAATSSALSLVSQAPSSDDLSQYAADAAVPEVEAANILARITRAARDLRDARADVVRAQEALALAQERCRVMEERTLPDLMDEAAQKRLTTIDGYTLERGETLRASIPPANLPQAIAWLKANNQGAIVKREIKLDFGKGEEQRAAEAIDLVQGAGYHPTDKQFVHPMTLAATVREMVEAGVDVPMQLLGVFVQPHVKVTPPKGTTLPKKAAKK